MKSYSRAIFWMLAEITGAAVVILALAGGICLLGGQANLRAFSTAAQDLGLVALALGGMSLIGTVALARKSTYQMARTASPANINERAQQDVSDSTRRLRFVVIATGAGAISLLVGLWLWQSFVPLAAV